mmetsp:Transcript_8102/g.17528  ORF Transcript_8102/g.17528 Transcript_8102/m.17528 type:complete len:355 (+) Transcript_8102:249-1313(+)|eukprot:CAMPEP_0178508750 /NCGR_PEP_ID=MMETSP0696-20121128/20923_1 /TAXON_ID=265572 /ORGANISM="Extubocellulus spinifer, Strain CCMP396" /LENGTH=354 /DNA_ID=CAMNT_0020138333 /DNA_START=194 /DNA_END=1258 /DNA_ORIENTATION=-
MRLPSVIAACVLASSIHAPLVNAFGPAAATRCSGRATTTCSRPSSSASAVSTKKKAAAIHAVPQLGLRRTVAPCSRWRSGACTSTTVVLHSTKDDDSSNSSADDPSDKIEAIDTTVDDRLYRIRLPRAPGIEWGTDLSFSFVYVRELEPAGPADISGRIDVGDQLCEIRPVVVEQEEDAEAAVPGEDGVISLIGAPFDAVMSAFATLSKTVREVDLVFFRGTKDELKELCTGTASSGDAETITITVVQNKGAKDETIRTIEAKAGCNVREVLVDEGINVYQSFTRWTNCKGKQLCGTCIINVSDGGTNTNRKSMDEASTLRENPDGYRLSCVMFAYGDVTVETFPPIEAAQWTR